MKELENRSILSELKHMKDRMDSLLSEVFDVGKSSPTEESEEAESELWNPGVDVWETSQGWFLAADLPGVQEADLKVELAESQITIQGKREALAAGSELRIHQAERPGGSFRLSFALPPKMNSESVTAELKSGVLFISIPKDDATTAKSLKIEVRTD